MGCASSKQQLKNVIANVSDRTNGTFTDSERTFSERTYWDKVNPSAMMTTATGEVAKIETERPTGRHSPVNRDRSGKVGPAPGSNTKTCVSESNKHRRESTVKSSSGDNSKNRRESPPIQIHRSRNIDRSAKTGSSKMDRSAKTGSSKMDRSAKTCSRKMDRSAKTCSRKMDRSGKTYPGASLELDSDSNHSSRSTSLRSTSLRSTSDHSAVMFKANCDRQSLAAALDQFDLEDFSNHTSSTSHYHEDPLICIVRSDKLAFSGAGIRRHSRRKRHRQLGKDNTKIVILRQPSFKELAAVAAAEAEAEKANKELEEECAKQRSERQLSRANSRKNVGKSIGASKPSTNHRINDAAKLEKTPVRSNSVIRLGSSSGAMMFEDKSEDLDMWPLPLTTAVS